MTGLGDVGVGPEVVDPANVLVVTGGRQHDDGNPPQLGVGLDLGQRLATVLAGHVEVEQDQRWARALRGLRRTGGSGRAQVVQQLLSVGDELHLFDAAGLGERVPGEIAVVLVIVGHQDDERLKFDWILHPVKGTRSRCGRCRFIRALRDCRGVNFSRDVVEAAPPGDRALVEIARDGSRREYTFGEIADASARMAGSMAQRGVSRGDVVLTLVGNRPDWVLALVACFRIGAVALPCNEQLRARDLRARLDAARPRLIVADERNAAVLGEAGVEARSGTRGCEVLLVPDPELLAADPAPAVDLAPTDPCLITFTSGTTGTAKGIVHGQRYLPGQALQATDWLDARPGDLVWCTAASGWSKSARNVFIAPWLNGAAALVHDARFDPEQRLRVLAREKVDILCMAPTEYRVIAKRAALTPVPSLRGLVAAGEALNPEVLRAFREGMGLEIRDGYGQTETGQLTGTPPGGEVRPGSMGRPLPGVELDVRDGELVLADPRSDPTFFVGYLEGTPGARGPPLAYGRPGQRRRRRLPLLRGARR